MDMYLFEQPYQTVNGEAEHIGKPCVFIRFQGCHVGCNWCDAMGTWPEKKGDMKVGVFHTNETLSAYLENKFPVTERMWITGGEPMEHKDEIYSLIEYHRKHVTTPRTWHLITSGSVYDEKTLMQFDHITIDVKPPSAHAKSNSADNHFIELCMEHMDLSEKVEFKMVVDNTSEDITWVENMIDKLSKYDRDITIQPMYWSEAEVKSELDKAQLVMNTKTFLENFQQAKSWPDYATFAEHFMDNPYKNLRILPQLHKIYWPGQMSGI